jgi:tape measure domain-containing protein
MSTTVDQRVVEMRFDNQNFERNVQTSMSTLDKLKQKLHLKGASKGLEEISTEAKKCNLSPLSTAVEGVRVKFSAMEVMAVTALSNITNSAVNAGKRMIKALTIEPVTTGFNEYETKINAVQTILANTQSKGTQMSDVTKVLDELNTYADKTIYNFAEMTKNIGTFTAAGIGLEESASAIQGIANLAAVSGSTSQQASTAMYQLSQALAAGRVSLQDWNSVVNAGMGGQVFQDALKRTAKTMGIVVDESKSFRESISGSDSWLSAEVLTETLTQFTMAAEEGSEKWEEYKKSLKEKGYTEEQAVEILKMANTATNAATEVKTFTQLWDTMKESVQSGWSQTWELIIGDFEEAKSLLTGISNFFGDIIQKVSDARNKVLEGALGRTFSDLTDKINKAISPAKKAVDTVTNVKDAVSDLGDIVNDVIIGKFGNGQERIDKLTEAGQNYYRVQNKVNETLGNAFRYTDEQIEAQDKLLGKQKEKTDGTAKETAETVKLTKAQKNTLLNMGAMTIAEMKSAGLTWEQIAALKELGKTADQLGMPIGEFIDKMDEIDGRWLLIDSFKSIGKGLVEVFKAIGQAWKNVFPSTIDDKANTLFNIIAAFHKFSRGVLTAATENADKFRRTFEGLFAILDIVRTVAGGALGFAFKLINSILKSMNLNILDVTAGIGDALVAFRNWLKENNFIVTALESLASFIGNAIVAVRDFVKMVLEIPEVQNAITNFQNACSNVFSSIGDFFSKGGERIKEFIDRVKAMDSITLDDLGKIFEDFRKNVLGYFFNFDGIFEGIKNGLQTFRDWVEKCLGDIGNRFGWAKDKLSGFIEMIKTRLPAAIAIVGTFAGIIIPLNKFITILDKMAHPFDVIEDVLNSFASFLKAKAWEAKANAVLKLALALGVLTACIVALTLVKPERLWESVGALAALMGVLAVFTLLITLIGKLGSADPNGVGKGLATMSLSMLGMAISLQILVDSLKKMEDLDPDKIGISLAALAGMAVGLVALSVVLSRLGGKASVASAVTMIAMALALKMMVGVLNDLGSLNLGKSLVALGLLFGILSAFKLVLKSCNGVKAGAAITLIGIVLALKMTIGAIETLGKMDSRTITKGLIAIIPILAMFSLVMAASKLAGQNAAKAGVGILAMSVAMVVLIHAMKQLAGMNQSDLDKGLKTVATVLALFGAIVALSYFAGKNATRAGVMLLMMSGAILILTGVIWALQAVPSEGLNRALGAIAIISLIFGALIVVSKLAGDCKGMIIVLTIAVVALAAVVMALSMLDPSALGRATVALDSIIAVFALLVFALGTIQKSNVGSAIGAVLALTLVVIALAAVLGAMTYLPNPDALLPAAGSLSLLLLAFSAALLILSKVGQISANTIGSAYALSGVVAILALILGAMTFLPNPQPLILISASLSLLLLSFSAAMLILSKVGTIAASTIGAAYAMSGVVAILGGILSAMTFLPDPSPLILIASALSIMLLAFSAALLILSKVGDVAPSAVGAAYALTGVLAIIGGILSAMSFLPNPEALIPIAESLSIMIGALALVCVVLTKAGVNAAAAVDAALGFDAFVGIVAALLVALGGLAQIPGFNWLVEEGGDLLCKIGYILGDFVGSIIGGIGAGITSGLPDMAADISAFGEGIKPFLDSMSNVSPEVVDGVKNLAAAILVITAANFLDSITSFMTGGKSLEDFASNISELGKGLKGFASEIKGIDGEAVKAGGEAVKSLAEAASAIPNEGGWLGAIVGENDMETFAEKLPKLGEGIKDFADEIKGVNPEEVTAGANAFAAIAEAAGKIPNEGGWISVFTGDNSIDDFAAKLPNVGMYLRQFSEETSGMDLDVVKNGSDALLFVADAATKIPNEGGWAAAFAGENDITVFTAKLPNVGTYLRQFSEELSGLDLGTIQNGSDALIYIANAATKIPKDGGLAGVFAGENDIATFGTKLTSLGSGIAGFASSLKNDEGTFEYGTVNNGVKALGLICDAAPSTSDLIKLSVVPDSFGTKLESLGSGMAGFANKLGEFKYEIVRDGVSGVKLVAGMSSSIPEESDKFVTFGENLTKFGSQMSDYFGSMAGVSGDSIVSAKSAVDAVKNFTTAINPEKVSAAVDSTNKLVKMVKNLEGIDANSTSGFTSAINNLAKTSVNKLVTAFKSASPEMSNAGKSLISKFIEGAKSGGAKVGDTSKSIVTKFVTGINSQKSKMSQTGKTIAEQISKSVKSQATKFKSIAVDFMKKFMDGLKSKQTDAKNAAKNVVKACIEKANTEAKNSKTAGKYFVTGFVNGISENQFKAKAQAIAMAEAALEAAEEALGINSPSKETYRIGGFFGQGFVNAVEEYSSKSYNAAYGMADYAKAGLSGAISKINDVMNSDIDSQPTIRPVIDLTNVESGANAINSMLNRRPSIGVMSEVRSIGSMMTWQSQNGTNDDVVSAIRELSDKLSGSSGDNYSINGITYDDGSNVSNAVKTLVRAARVGRRR